MIRDLVETTFLLDLFKCEKPKIKEWRTLPERQRKEAFKPIAVRKRLDDLDGFKERRREAAYKLLSTYAAHPTPEGFMVVSPESMTHIGPFPDEKRLMAGLQELAKYLTYAAVVISGHADKDNGNVLAAKAAFFPALERWTAKYMPEMATSKEGG